MSTILKLIAFDLDGTIWAPEMYELWGGGSPFSIKSPSVLLDKRKTEVTLLGKSHEILSMLSLQKQDIKIAFVSTCDEPDWANECLQKFKLTTGKPIKSIVDVNLIYKANKRDHFMKLKQQYPEIEYKEMLFFDNQINNISDVSRIGVECLYCPDGLTKEAWEKGLSKFDQVKMTA